MKHLFALISCIFCFSQLSAQTQMTEKEFQKLIVGSGEYYVGRGSDSDERTADQMALSDLASQIQVTISSDFSYLMEETDRGGGISSAEAKMKGVVESYTNATLKNVQKLVPTGSKNLVFRYMKKSELDEAFRQRVNRAKKWATEGFGREKEGKIGDALQNLYWALALLRSCPNGNQETIFTEGGERNLSQMLFQHVKDILANISVSAVDAETDDDEMTVTINVSYNGKPVSNFYYTCSQAVNPQQLLATKDGVGMIDLPASVKLKRLNIKAEYEGSADANIDPELHDVIRFTSRVPFQNSAELAVDARSCVPHTYSPEVNKVTAAQQVVVPSKADASQTIALTTVPTSQVSPYLSSMQQVIDGIRSRNYKSLQSLFTDEGYDMFNRLVAYGQARISKTPDLQFVDSRGGVVCRSLPMSFTFKGNGRTFVEDVVFRFNASGKIAEVSFALEKAAYNDIMGRGPWTEDARNTMVHFLETYKTAYALKRLDYISSIFSEDALIITGSIVKSSGQKELKPSSVQHVKYTRQTKQQYMENLRKCFGSNEYINIRFADNNVRRRTGSDIYGIQIKQDYYSSSYGDTGYLFLLIDFKNPNAPLIHVRAWQPDKAADIKDGRIGFQDFDL